MSLITIPSKFYPTHYTELYCVHPQGRFGLSITNCIEPDQFYFKFMHIDDRVAWVVRYPVERAEVYRLLYEVCPEMIDINLSDMRFVKQPTGPAQQGSSRDYDSALTLGGEPHMLTYGPADNRQAVEVAIIRDFPVEWLLTDPEMN